MVTVVCVGGLVRRADSILLVRQSEGHSLAGQWTIPWGEIDPGESPTAAVLREIREESGIDAEVDGLLGVQELPDPWLGMIGILFQCSYLGGESTPDMRETDAAQFFDQKMLEASSGLIEPLSAWVANRVLAGDAKLLPANDAGPFNPSPSYL